MIESIYYVTSWDFRSKFATFAKQLKHRPVFTGLRFIIIGTTTVSL